MDYLNYSIAVPENLELRLPFLELYKKSVQENLQAEEFMIKKVLESSAESTRDYIGESKIPESHPYNLDSKYTKTIVRVNQTYGQGKSSEPETFKLIVEKTTECINLKDSIMRDMKKEIEASLGHHHRTYEDVKNLVQWKQDLLDSLAKSDYIIFDAKRVKYARDSVNKMLERLNSAIGQNDRDIDDIIIKILFNLNTDKVDSLKSETDDLLKMIGAMNKKSYQNKRDESLQTLYDFFKRMLKSTHNLRSTYRSSVLANEADLIDANTLIGADLTDESIENPYFSKIEAVKIKMQQLMEVAIEKINAVKAKINSLKVMYNSIGEGAYSTKEQKERAFQDIIQEMINIDSTFYGLVIMDVGLFHTLLGKSYQFMNRKLNDAVHSTAHGFIEAENSSLYYRLIHQGDEEVPLLIDVFLSQYKSYMAHLHQENVDRYLITNFDDETAETSEEETWRTVVMHNNKSVSKAINLAVDMLNLFLEEVNSGRNRNGINYNIFNKDYPHLMLRLSPKLGQMEEFKKFAINAFDPKAWRADKKRIQSISQMIYDLAALEHDSTMNNNRKFNTMRDHVNTIKNEISYFSSIIFSAQKSRPDIQDIIRSYTETLKGLWNRINKEILSAEQVMIQVLRTAKFDANSQYTTGIEIKPEEVKAAHLKQKALVDEIYDFVLLLDENVMIYSLGQVGQKTISLTDKHKAIVEDKNMLRCFSRILSGFEKEFDYNELIFQDFIGDLLGTLSKLCSLYGGLELTNYKNHLLMYKNADSQTTIRNMIIGPLQDYAEFIDSSLFKKTMKGAEKYNPKIVDRLTALGQNYFEYNKTLIDIANLTMKLGVARNDAEKAQLIQAIEKLVKFRADKFYKEISMVVVDAIKEAFPYQLNQSAGGYQDPVPAFLNNQGQSGLGSNFNQTQGQNQYNGTNTQDAFGNPGSSQIGGQGQYGQQQQPGQATNGSNYQSGYNTYGQTQGKDQYNGTYTQDAYGTLGSSQLGGQGQYGQPQQTGQVNNGGSTYQSGYNTYNQPQGTLGQGGNTQINQPGQNGTSTSNYQTNDAYANQGQYGQSTYGQPQQGGQGNYAQSSNYGQNQHGGQKYESGFEPFGQSSLGNLPGGVNVQSQFGGQTQTGQNLGVQAGVQGQYGGYNGQGGY